MSTNGSFSPDQMIGGSTAGFGNEAHNSATLSSLRSAAQRTMENLNSLF
jgi:hypothetical protein